MSMRAVIHASVRRYKQFWDLKFRTFAHLINMFRTWNKYQQQFYLINRQKPWNRKFWIQ